MKAIKLYYRCLSIVSFIIGSTVVLDTFIFKQFLKNLMVKANTSSISPYNSDGVLNIVVIVFLMCVIPAMVHTFFILIDRKEDE